MNCKYIFDPISRDAIKVWLELDDKRRTCVFCSDAHERYGREADLVVSEEFKLRFDKLVDKYYADLMSADVLEKILLEIDDVLTIEHVWVIYRRTGHVIMGHDTRNMHVSCAVHIPQFKVCPSAR